MMILLLSEKHKMWQLCPGNEVKLATSLYLMITGILYATFRFVTGFAKTVPIGTTTEIQFMA